MQRTGKHPNEDECKPEVRNSLENGGHRGNDVIKSATTTPTSPDTKSLLNKERYNRGCADKTNGPRQCRSNGRCNLVGEIRYRYAPVAGEDILQIINILLEDVASTMSQHCSNRFPCFGCNSTTSRCKPGKNS